MLIVPLGGGFVLPDGPKSISLLGSSQLGLGSWGNTPPQAAFSESFPKKKPGRAGEEMCCDIPHC